MPRHPPKTLDGTIHAASSCCLTLTWQADSDVLVTHAILELVEGHRALVQLCAVAKPLEHSAERVRGNAMGAANRQLNVPCELQARGGSSGSQIETTIEQ